MDVSIGVKEMDVVASVDLGGTYTKFGLVDRTGHLLAENVMDTDSTGSYEHFFRNLCNKIEELKESPDSEFKILGIGFGAPSGNYITGKIESASNLSWPREIPVADLLQTYTGLPVAVSNDANAAAVGEKMFGIAQGVEDFISITLGTGLGSGIVVNGKLVTGAGGLAGELGHTTVIEAGRQCGCGKRGCLETYVSAPGICQSFFEKLDKREVKSRLEGKKKEEITPVDISQAAIEGDEVAIETFDETGRMLGIRLADAVTTLNPELIILSGGVANSGDLILKPVQKYIDYYLPGIYRGTYEVKISEMSNKNAALLGSAAFIWEKLDEESTLSVSSDC